jgi:acetylglutamate synthase
MACPDIADAMKIYKDYNTDSSFPHRKTLSHDVENISPAQRCHISGKLHILQRLGYRSVLKFK